jgi:DNA-binding transcriptional ArsR family regulator
MHFLLYPYLSMPHVPELKAEFFKAIGHPIRIRVLELLSEDEQAVADLLAAIDVGQAYLSQQLGVLRRAGLVTARRDGSRVLYALADPRMADLLAVSRQMLLDMATATRDELRSA